MFVGFAKVFNAAWHVVRHVASEKHWMASLFVATDFVVAVALVTCAVYKTIRLVQMSRVRTTAACLRDFLRQQQQQQRQFLENLANMQEDVIQENLLMNLKIKTTKALQMREEIPKQEVVTAQGHQEVQYYLQSFKNNSDIKEKLKQMESVNIMENSFKKHDVNFEEISEMQEFVNVKENIKMIDIKMAEYIRKQTSDSVLKGIDSEKYLKIKTNVIIIEDIKRTDTIQDKEFLNIEQVADEQESFHVREKIRTKQHLNIKEYPYELECGYIEESIITQDCLRTVEKFMMKEKSKMVENLQPHKSLNIGTYAVAQKDTQLKENMKFMGSITVKGDVQKTRELLNVQDDEFTDANLGRKIQMEKVKILNTLNVHQVVDRQHVMILNNLLKEAEYHKGTEKVKTQSTVKLRKEDTPKRTPESGKESISTLDDITTVLRDKQNGIPQTVVQEHDESIRKSSQDLETVVIEDKRLLVQCMVNDSDSFFEVVAHQMFKTSPGSQEHEKLSRMVRRMTSRMLKKNKSDYWEYLVEDVENLRSRYNHLVSEDDKVNQYLEDLRTSGTPAGVAAMHAIAEYYDLDIVVYVEPKGQRLIKNRQGKAIQVVTILQRAPTKSEFVDRFDSVVHCQPY